MNSATTAADISTLLDRYLIDLDEEKLDDAWARALFTDDARVEFPMARHEGIEGLAAWHRQALEAFARTQHLNSPAVVDLTGDERAALRANLVSTHVHHPDTPGDPLFVAGTLVHGEARRTERGWRLSELSFRLVWSTGSPPRSGDAR
ncbi:nuclear transport factor 2 family protein [Streptomyces sp. NPDC049627]|uniref:nuclear transport factor 2 family protein n=1 Tax=Streptomyces sp. NPDC049627 TaxID=3365595 RepID=UPI00379BFA32